MFKSLDPPDLKSTRALKAFRRDKHLITWSQKGSGWFGWVMYHQSWEDGLVRNICVPWQGQFRKFYWRYLHQGNKDAYRLKESRINSFHFSNIGLLCDSRGMSAVMMYLFFPAASLAQHPCLAGTAARLQWAQQRILDQGNQWAVLGIFETFLFSVLIFMRGNWSHFILNIFCS